MSTWVDKSEQWACGGQCTHCKTYDKPVYYYRNFDRWSALFYLLLCEDCLLMYKMGDLVG